MPNKKKKQKKSKYTYLGHMDNIDQSLTLIDWTK